MDNLSPLAEPISIPIQETDISQPIYSIQLIEKASQAFVKWFVLKFPKTKKIKFFCGMGDNGGNGLEIARLLQEKGYNNKIFIVQHTSDTSFVFNKNITKVSSHKWITQSKDIPKISDDEIVIDAILGVGLNRPIDKHLAEIVDKINYSKAKIISLDIASGLFAEKHTSSSHVIIPTYTVTINLPKLAFLMPENEKYIGEYFILDVGLTIDLVKKNRSDIRFISAPFVKSFFKKRTKYTTKESLGKALLMVGTSENIGSAILASRACLRVGVGKLTVHTPGYGHHVLQSSLPEASVIKDSRSIYTTQFPELESFTVVGIGPGIGSHPVTIEVFERLLKQANKPMILTDDAINILIKSKNLLNILPVSSILLMEPDEFYKLTHDEFFLKFDNDFEKLELLKKFTRKYNVVLILKTGNNIIALPNGQIHFNFTGNPGMIAHGTGDVLTGIVMSLMAQGYEPWRAAILGVYLHGLAGDVVGVKKGYSALIASDLIEEIPSGIKKLENLI